MILPDSTIIANYALQRITKVLDNLVVYPDRMIENLELTHGLIHSQKVLLSLAKKGIKRQEAYVWVQRNSMKTWDEKIPLIENLLNDEDIMKHFTEDELRNMFSYQKVFQSVDFIFARLGI